MDRIDETEVESLINGRFNNKPEGENGGDWFLDAPPWPGQMIPSEGRFSTVYSYVDVPTREVRH